MSEKVVFSQSMEGLYRALSPHTPAERAAFLAAGVKDDTKFAPAYPVDLHIAILDACAASRFAHLPELERYTEVGKLFFTGFQKTLIGSAMLAMLKILGPRRTLDRLTRNFRTANNFSEGTLTTLTPTHHHVHINFTKRPGFYLGLLYSGCLHAGAKDLKITVVETKDFATTYDIQFAPP
jgi:uncharacterized protein (TIGR02265 family)